MEQPKNPHTDNLMWLRSRPEVNSTNYSYVRGQKQGWDEGYGIGTERYFDLTNENDCADTLFTYLAVLQLRVAKEFGTDSVMHEVLESFFFNLQEAPVPPPGETDPLCALYLLDDEMKQTLDT